MTIGIVADAYYAADAADRNIILFNTQQNHNFVHDPADAAGRVPTGF